MLRPRIAVLALLALLGVGCGVADGPEDTGQTASADPSSPGTAPPAGLDSSAAADLGELAEEIASAQAGGGEPAATEPPDATGTDLPAADPRVVAISIDGLRSAAISAEETPAIYRLFVRGAGTFNARTTLEQTETLPNHACMVTGRRVDPAGDGHGVTWNTDTDQTVRAGVPSVFSVIDDAGGSSAVIAGKGKFDIFTDSWPGTIDRFDVVRNMATAADRVVTDLRAADRDLLFWHLAGPDRAGHAAGWGSDRYENQVRNADTAVGTVVDAIADDAELAANVVVVLTSDHGGVLGESSHDQTERPGNYMVPFVVWGPGVQAGELYGLNPGYADPGTGRPGYDGTQPVRNCDLANVVAGVLDLPAVPGSQFGVDPALELSDR